MRCQMDKHVFDGIFLPEDVDGVDVLESTLIKLGYNFLQHGDGLAYVLLHLINWNILSTELYFPVSDIIRLAEYGTDKVVDITYEVKG